MGVLALSVYKNFTIKKDGAENKKNRLKDQPCKKIRYDARQRQIVCPIRTSRGWDNQTLGVIYRLSLCTCLRTRARE